jgi:type II secretory pathway pseudopilin PulG
VAFAADGPADQPAPQPQVQRQQLLKQQLAEQQQQLYIQQQQRLLQQQQQQQQLGALASSSSGGGGAANSTPTGPSSSNAAIRMSVQLVATYRKCTQGHATGDTGAVPQPLPRRVLTRPAAAARNDGHDNEGFDLILSTQVGGCVCA